MDMRPPSMADWEFEMLMWDHYALLVSEGAPVIHAQIEYLFKEKWGARIEEWKAEMEEMRQ